MRPTLAHALAALVAAAALSLSSCRCGEPAKPPPPPAQAQAGLAELVTVEGPVELTRAGKAEPAKAPLTLLKGDALATGEKGRAVLRFKGGREVELGENARFVISEGAGEISLEITGGMVISRVTGGGAGGPPGEGGVTLAILTPGGITRVPLGGEATVDVGAGGTTIEVRTGEITFVGKDGQSRAVKGGEKVEVALGEVRIVRPGESLTPDAGAPADGAGAAVTLDAILVTLSAERGVVQVKGASDAKYRAVAKSGEAIAQGTAFKLAPGSKGTLAGGGIKVKLAGGSEGSLGKVEKTADGAESYELGLAKGSAQLVFDQPGKKIVKLAGPNGTAEVEGDGEATLAWARDAKTGRLEVQAGSVQVRYQGQTQALSAGDSAKLSKGISLGPRKAPPAVSLPAGRRVRVFANGLREVALTWPTLPGAKRIEVSLDPAFKEVLLSGAATGNQIAAAAPAQGELNWRVLGERGGEPLARGRASFGPERVVAMAGGHPINEVAETGLKATVYYQSVLPALVFSFPAVEGASKYRVRVYKADELIKPLVDKTVTERRFAAEPGKLAEGGYLWNATPLGAAGNELAGGRMNRLDIVYDNAMVALTIQEPGPGPLGAGAEIKTRGVAPLGSKLFVNGKSAALDPQGRFELSVPRAATLVYRLVGADGSESYWLRGTASR
ncbi:MAG TPA: hypothetical protein VGK67_28235 [Myxococcales bacterium]